MQGAVSNRSMVWLRGIFLAAAVASIMNYVVLSWHWPMMWDAPVMRYVNFLMDHGMQPYSQIGDMNMPGAYLTDRWATWVFGQSDAGSRLFEFFEMGLLIAASIATAGRRLWFGGFYAAAFFVVMHASEGPLVATERDELVMVLIVIAFAFLFQSVRRSMPSLMIPFGVAMALAASVKPTIAPLELLLLGLMVLELRRRSERWLPSVLWALAGTAIITAVILDFFLRHHAIGPFLLLVRTVLPSYATMNHPSFWAMSRQLLPITVLLILPFAAIAAVQTRSWVGWEEKALAAGAAIGAFSYLAQGKGFIYHRYLFVMLLLLCAGKALDAAMRSGERSGERSRRAVGATGVALTLLLVLPYYVFLAHHWQSTRLQENAMAVSIESDLTRLGGDKLQSNVQCFDLVGGCLNALYHLRLVQRTGTTGDMLFFSPVEGPEVKAARKSYWAATRNNPPEVIVLGNEWFQGTHNSFSKIDTWPELAEYMQVNYKLVATRTFSPKMQEADAKDPVAPAYRIYLLRGSPLDPSDAPLRAIQDAHTSPVATGSRK